MAQEVQYNKVQQWSINNPRASGAILALLFGGVNAYFISDIFKKIENQEPITLYGKFIAVFSALFFLGVAMMIFGEKLQTRLIQMKERKKNSTDILILAAIVLPGLAVYIALEIYLNSLGYK